MFISVFNVLFYSQRNPQRMFWNLPEGSGTFRKVLECSLHSMFISVFNALFYSQRNPQRTFRNLPEGSGTFRKVLECSLHSMFISVFNVLFYSQRIIPKECFPEPSRRFHIPHTHSCTHIPHKNLYFVTMTLFLTYIFLCRPVNWTRLVLLLSLRSPNFCHGVFAEPLQ